MSNFIDKLLIVIVVFIIFFLLNKLSDGDIEEALMIVGFICALFALVYCIVDDSEYDDNNEKHFSAEIYNKKHDNKDDTYRLIFKHNNADRFVYVDKDIYNGYHIGDDISITEHLDNDRTYGIGIYYTLSK